VRKLVLVVLLGLLAALLAAPPAVAKPKGDKSLPKLVKVENIRAHQRALQQIATFNGGTRAVNTAGYAVSVSYVVDQLKRAGYKPEVKPFEYLAWEEAGPSELEQLAPGTKSYTYPGDFGPFQYSPNAEATAAVTAVDTASADSGCQAADFAGFPAGNIALIKRGTCFFEEKATNAVTAGAVGVLIFNDGASPDRTGPLTGFDLQHPFEIPVLGPSFAAGTELNTLAQAGTLRVRMFSNTLMETRTSQNVIAETKRGRHDNVVVVGAHLDSVPAGPGINDNGSGTATILEIAKQVNKLSKLNNAVRFAWWGAEEIGLLGSEAYVASLSEAELGKIALNLNFDMLGSPNFVRFVYDGDNSAFPADPPNVAEGPPGSGAIEKVFTDYLAGRGLASDETPFDGRSDYGPFIAAGIPAGGLFSGAEDPKTAEQAAVYGGTVDVALDPCYHQACDTFDNNNLTVLDQLSDAAADAVQEFARSTLVVNGVSPRANLRAQRAGGLTLAHKGPNVRR
jgi:Zn-dependent M28 family amino/carboxypeptidase